MTRAAVVTRWVPDDTGFGLALFRDVAVVAGDRCVDVTVQPGENVPPQPNVLIVEVNCSDATLAAIKAHGQYGAAAVLWEGDPAQSPVVTTNQYNALVTFLANKFNATETQVRNLLGATAAGRTRYALALEIIAYLRARPKA